MDLEPGSEPGRKTEPRAGGRTPARDPEPVATPSPVSNQLRFYRILSVVLIAMILGGVGYHLYNEQRTLPVKVLVGGAPIATVVDYQTANSLVAQLAARQLGPAYTVHSSPESSLPIQLQRVAADSPVDSTDDALAKLAAATRLSVMADVICINGKQIVGLADKVAAQAALDEVRQHYIAMPPADMVTDKPTFREKVEIKRKRVAASICVAGSEAAAQLLMAVPPAKTTTVEPHETGWSIARKFHMSFGDFVRANSGNDINHLMPGDTVNVSRSFPPLTVIVHKEHTALEPILAGAPADAAGERRVTSIDTYVNGVRAGQSQPVSVFVVRPATPRGRIM
jgi:LysM repeat protein